jgi:hypothetical protein
MWKDWNRWWDTRGAAGEGPPEETKSPTHKSENDHWAWDERIAVEAETSPEAKEDAVEGNSENAAESIGETVQPVEGVDGPAEAGSTDLVVDAAPDLTDVVESSVWDDAGADGSADAATSKFANPPAGFDPVAELGRQGLQLPAGKGRIRAGP